MTGEFARIKRTTNLYEEVVEIIKKAIISGRYQPGDPLPSEMELAHQLGVSRPVVREALRSLQYRGFLEIRRGIKGGAYVCDLRRLGFSQNLADLIRARRVTVDHLAQARLFLEPEVCRLAALNATPRQLQGMRDLLAQYEDTPDKDRRVTLNALFHRLVGRACGNPFYSLLVESIMDFTEGFVRTIKPVTRIIHEDREHALILEALKARHPQKAARIMAGHITHIVDEMRKLEETYLRLLAEEEYPKDRSALDSSV